MAAAECCRIGASASKFTAQRLEVRAARWVGYDVGGLMPDVDEERFPGFARYLAALPNGLLSYPAHVAKASLLRGVLDFWGGADRVAGLPEPLLGAMKNPPPPNAWLPEVLYVAGHYAIVDIDGLDSETILQLTYRANRRLPSRRCTRCSPRWPRPWSFCAAPRSAGASCTAG